MMGTNTKVAIFRKSEYSDLETLRELFAESPASVKITAGEASTLFAVRRRDTNQYIMARKKLRGGTAEEPLPWPGTPGRIPRTFHSLRAARAFLTAWCKGEWKETRGGQDPLTGEWDDSYPEVVPGTTRDRATMEIVEFALVEVEVHG